MPIIARDISVFREVAGEYVFYLGGIGPQALAGSVKNWLELNAEGKAPRPNGMHWLTRKQNVRYLLDILAPVNGGSSKIRKDQ